LTKNEADLLELMQADRTELTRRQAAEVAIDREAAGEVVPAARIARVTQRQRQRDA